MRDLLEWIFSTKLGYFIYLVVFTTTIFFVLKWIFPNFMNVGYFFGSIPTAIVLTLIKSELTSWI